MLNGSLTSSGLSGKCEEKYKKIIENLTQFASECNSSAEDDEKNPLKEGIYNCINTNIRKEYEFLNNCCDVRVENQKLRFLVERYLEDVFEDKILVLVYDGSPDTMERAENIRKLKELYRNVLAIEDGKPIIEVYDNGGRRMAACVFLPFKNHFVSELIQNKITPNEFFGAFSAIYHPVKRQMEIVLQIKGFPYSFRKYYQEKNWTKLYGTKLEATYIWPIAQVDSEGWRNYYIYTEEMEDTGVEISVPEAVSQIKYSHRPVYGKYNKFQLCKSHTFPAYLCFTYDEVSGFLPIWTKHLGTDQIGSAASIIVDLGHATTSISIIKEYGGDMQQGNWIEGQDVCFWSPRSSRIVGNRDGINAVNMNFVIPDEEKKEEINNCIKNMMHCFRKYDRIPVIDKERKPFEDGQVLFDSSAYLNDFQESIVSYINFEYALMDQIHREKAHIFIEQLLVYAVYQIITWKCSYVRVYFLHDYQDGDTRLGELKGLWDNALLNVRRRTGINSAGTEDTIAVKEHEALGYYVYGQVYKENMARNSCAASESINVGVNIGWKSTQVAVLSPADSKKEGGCCGIVEHAKLEYAGRNISMLVDADSNSLNLPVYPKLLQILLGGQNLSNKQDVQRMLTEFSQLFGNRQKEVTHYQGVFDAIAMKIDEEGYCVSPDVFNNMPEFRYYIMAITYNFLLLFLSIGSILGQIKKETTKQVNLYLGGNGAKFLKWISNDKHFSEIRKSDSHELLILPVEEGLLECLANAAGLELEKVEIRIILVDKPEEQLVRGCRTMMIAQNVASLKIEPQPIPTDLDSEQYKDFVDQIVNLRKEIFSDFSNLQNVKAWDSVEKDNKISVVELIENERKEVCSEVMKEITYINSKPYTP